MTLIILLVGFGPSAILSMPVAYGSGRVPFRTASVEGESSSAIPTSLGGFHEGTALARGVILENAGQVANSSISFYALEGSTSVGFTKNGILLLILEDSPWKKSMLPESAYNHSAGQRGVLVRLSWVGGDNVVPEGRGELPHRSHFLLGASPSGWRREVRSYREVVYHGIYPGIDAVFQVQGGLKYEYHILPGRNPSAIVMAVEGIDALAVRDGELTFATPLGELRDSRPRAAQGSTDVPCSFRLLRSRSFGFECQGWDPERELVIDPLIYSTFLGGTADPTRGDYELGASIVVDIAGNAYVAGATNAPDFPVTPGAFDTSYSGNCGWCADAYVAKLDSTGTGLVFATYLGGSGWDSAYSITLDANGNIFVAGTTFSSNFPTTFGAFDPSYNGGNPMWPYDAFVAKLNATGSDLLYSTYLGGSDPGDGRDYASSIAIDSEGNAYVAGGTAASDFPVTPGAWDTSYAQEVCGLNGEWCQDTFVAKLDSSGGALVYATYVGGSWDDGGYPALAIDIDGNAVVSGTTTSWDFPVTPGAWDPWLNGTNDVYITKLNASGSGPVFSTLLGGEEWDEAGRSVLLDVNGDVILSGRTCSPDFPVTPAAYDTTYNDQPPSCPLFDGFVARLEAMGSAVTYATYLGADGDDSARSIAWAPSGELLVVGYTDSSGFPTVNADDANPNGDYDAFVALMSPTLADLNYSSFLGGSSPDGGSSVAVDSVGAVYVTGETSSGDFPTTLGAFDTVLNGTSDAFIAKIDLVTTAPLPTPHIDWIEAGTGPVAFGWSVPTESGLEGYAIYGGTSPIAINLATPVTTTLAGTRNWTDVVTPALYEEYYYVVRAFNSTIGASSRTSNTAGWFTSNLVTGTNAFSLPLRPLSPVNISEIRSSMGAEAIAWMVDGSWIWFDGTDPTHDHVANVSEGYVAILASAPGYLFAGEPGAMISHRGASGFLDGERSSLRASTAAADIILEFTAPALPGMDLVLYRARSRQGVLEGDTRSEIARFPAPSAPEQVQTTDVGAAALSGEVCYIVVPLDMSGTEHSSSYSTCIAVVPIGSTAALGVPLRPYGPLALHEFVRTVPGALGMLWVAAGVWVPHFAVMPVDVYDVTLRQAAGYQLSVKAATFVYFPGN